MLAETTTKADAADGKAGIPRGMMIADVAVVVDGPVGVDKDFEDVTTQDVVNWVDVVFVALGVERGGGARRCFGDEFGDGGGGGRSTLHSGDGDGDGSARDRDSLPGWQSGGRRFFIGDYLASFSTNDLVVVIVRAGSFGCDAVAVVLEGHQRHESR